jgi:thioesterase domain-containing protein
MTDTVCSFLYLPGAAGGAVDLTVLAGSLGEEFNLQLVDYPGWQRYVADGFTAESLIEELTSRIAAAVPHGPIRIAGASLGGHFAYAAALRLQRMGREIAGLVAIDTFMIDSSGPRDGWQSRALSMALDLVRKGDVRKIMQFMRSRFWRATFRLAGGRLLDKLRRVAPSGRLPGWLAIDPIAEEELSMRLLLGAVAPWVAALDRDPVPLVAPVILLRTHATEKDDAAWLIRCPEIDIFEIPGEHLTLFEQENIGSLRDAFIRATRECAQQDAESEMLVGNSVR